MINTLFGPLWKRLPENNQLERIWVLAKVDFKSRYYYHRLGVLWALIRPIIELMVYYVLFTNIFKNDIENFALYLFSGLVIWYYFVEGTSKGINILLSKRYLIESIPFNKINLILASTLSSFMGFTFNFMAYLGVSIFLGVPPMGQAFLFFPIIVLITSVLIMGISLILATLSIYLKDIQHLWDMVILAGFWMTPIVYSETVMENSMGFLKLSNPMAPIVINVHHTVLYNRAPDYFLLGYSTGLALVLFVIGYILFTNFSHKAAEKL